jgi:Tol biopolymer transport system component
MRLTRVVLLVLLMSAQRAAAQPAGSAADISKRIEYWNPVWSPDGRTILFESTLNGPAGVFVIQADGSGLRRLTPDTSSNYQPHWSPDGTRIVFSSTRGGHGDLYLMNADGSGVTRLTSTSGGAWYQASFSPDGRRIVFQGRQDNAETRDRVFVINADGSGLRQLSDSMVGAEGPHWSPDGTTIRFLQVPYPKRLWREMTPGDMQVAKTTQRMVSIRPDGSGLTTLPTEPAGESGRVWSRDGKHEFFIANRDSSTAVFQRKAGNTAPMRIASTDIVPDGFEPSPDGSKLAYSKAVGGYAALYAYDIATRQERFLTGGAAAGPLGYLRTAVLTASSDTFDTFTSLKTGGPRTAGGTSYVRAFRQIGAARWEVTDQWSDSGRITTRQSVRTFDGTLATEIETVRADRDSASLLVSARHVTAWVVPEGQAPKLHDGEPAGDRYAGSMIIAAIAKSRPAISAVFQAPSAALYGNNPLLPVVDSITVVARDTLWRGTTALPVLVMQRHSGTRFWVDEATGVQVAARGNAGPERSWWHIRRGVRFRD